MMLLKILLNLNMLAWVWRSFTSLVVGLILAVFFGLFTEGWFFWPVLWVYWIPAIVLSGIKAIRDHRELSPLNDVANLFNPKASAKQKQRAASVLKQEIENEQNMDEELDTEEEPDEPDDPEVGLGALKELIQVLGENGFSLRECTQQTLEEWVEYYYYKGEIDLGEWLPEALSNSRDIPLEDVDFDAEYYETLVKSVIQAGQLSSLAIVGSRRDEENNRVYLLMRDQGILQEWSFTCYQHQPATNLFTHLALWLNQHGLHFHMYENDMGMSYSILNDDQKRFLAEQYQFSIREAF